MTPARGIAGLVVALVLAGSACSAVDHGAAQGPDGSGHEMPVSSGAPPSVATPGADGVDAGFAYDMSRHHSQAVEMAEMVSGRTTDPDVGVLARDIVLTQQYQIGEMRGWLDGWGLPATSLADPMRWMGMDMAMAMPGMATDEELAALRDAGPGEVDRLFLELMIRHHEGGVEMAEAAAARATVSYVRALATGIVESQAAEVATMQEMLAELDGP
jgi:uncharacterized protein (DUF305 family)